MSVFLVECRVFIGMVVAATGNTFPEFLNSRLAPKERCLPLHNLWLSECKCVLPLTRQHRRFSRIPNTLHAQQVRTLESISLIHWDRQLRVPLRAMLQDLHQSMFQLSRNLPRRRGTLFLFLLDLPNSSRRDFFEYFRINGHWRLHFLPPHTVIEGYHGMLGFLPALDKFFEVRLPKHNADFPSWFCDDLRFFSFAVRNHEAASLAQHLLLDFCHALWGHPMSLLNESVVHRWTFD